jgi:hypothetical protein
MANRSFMLGKYHRFCHFDAKTVSPGNKRNAPVSKEQTVNYQLAALYFRTKDAAYYIFVQVPQLWDSKPLSEA